MRHHIFQYFTNWNDWILLWKMLKIQEQLLAWINPFMKTIWNPFETNLNWNMRDFEKNKLKGIILENLIYTLEKTYRNGNDMICSIDINGKKIERQFWKWTWNSESVKPLSQSKCFTCLKPTTAETQYSRQFWAKIWFFEYGKNWQLMKKKKKTWTKILENVWTKKFTGYICTLWLAICKTFWFVSEYPLEKYLAVHG